MTVFATVLQVLAGVLQVLGAILMANAHVAAVQRWQVPTMLLSAIVRGPVAKGAARLDGIASSEDHLTTLQGLGLIGGGFLFQLVAALLSLKW